MYTLYFYVFLWSCNSNSPIVLLNYRVYLYVYIYIFHEMHMYQYTSGGTQSMQFLKALQDIHLGQPRITFPSPFCVAGVGQSILSPPVNIRYFKAFGGWKCDRDTTTLLARIQSGKGVQRKKPNMFTVGSSTSVCM